MAASETNGRFGHLEDVEMGICTAIMVSKPISGLSGSSSEGGSIGKRDMGEVWIWLSLDKVGHGILRECYLLKARRRDKEGRRAIGHLLFHLINNLLWRTLVWVNKSNVQRSGSAAADMPSTEPVVS